MIVAKDIETTLLSIADEHQARQMLRFFKTAPGEYGVICYTKPQGGCSARFANKCRLMNGMCGKVKDET